MLFVSCILAVEKTGVPLVLAAFGEMSHILLVTGTPVLSTTLCSLKIYHFLSHIVQSTATSPIWPIPTTRNREMGEIVLVTGTPILSVTTLSIKK